MTKEEALSILHINEEDFYNKNIMKVFNGIGGSAKSTAAAFLLKLLSDEILQETYARYTSTNKLKKDAIRRFGGDTFTIAGGLFNTVDGIFFSSEKDIQYKNIIIDEALQTSKKVFDLAKKLVGKVNVIICTDSEQMLPPSSDGSILKAFNELCTLDFVKEITLTNSLRAVNDYSRSVYNDCYSKAGNGGFELYSKYRKKMNWCNFDDISYSPDNAYICHSNELEDMLYRKYNLFSRYDLDLIPKGSIASKNIEDLNLEKYNILSQKEALKTKANSYLQISNIGSVTRYQGSEVEQGNKLFFLVKPNDIVGNREFYTMVTRAKDVSDVVLVYTDVKEPEKIETFFGHPVKKPVALEVTDKTVIPDEDGKTIADVRNISQSGTKPLKNDELQSFYIDSILEYASRREAMFYTSLIEDGHKVKTYSTEENVGKPKTTMHSILKKTVGTDFEKMPKFLRAMEKLETEHKNELMEIVDRIITPLNMDVRSYRTYSDRFTAGLDMCAAYPSAFKFGKVCDGREFSNYDEFQESTFWENEDDYVGFFFNMSKYGATGMIITDSLVKTMRELDPDFKAYFIGCSPVLRNPKFADWLYERAFRSKEDKKFVHDNIHYGWLQHKYLTKVYTDKAGSDWIFGLEENNNHELLMCCVQSDMLNFVVKCKYAIYGNITSGKCCVDCVYFNKEQWTEETKEKINDIRNGYDYRVFENTKDGKTSDKPIIYKTYEDLKTKKANRRIRERNRQRAKRSSNEE